MMIRRANDSAPRWFLLVHSSEHLEIILAQYFKWNNFSIALVQCLARLQSLKGMPGAPPSIAHFLLDGEEVKIERPKWHYVRHLFGPVLAGHFYNRTNFRCVIVCDSHLLEEYGIQCVHIYMLIFNPKYNDIRFSITPYRLEDKGAYLFDPPCINNEILSFLPTTFLPTTLLKSVRLHHLPVRLHQQVGVPEKKVQKEKQFHNLADFRKVIENYFDIEVDKSLHVNDDAVFNRFLEFCKYDENNDLESVHVVILDKNTFKRTS